VGLIAATLAILAKWLLTPNIRSGQQHPLWSFFVWRHELVTVFIESLAVPWFVSLSYGTPILTFWLRGMGAKIESGVWCDSHYAGEFDLIRVDAGATVNRNSVLQSHLFHERLMRMDKLHLRAGATLGPHSIALPDTVIGAGTTIGPCSLVMRGERIPDGTRWLGNPVGPWLEDGENDTGTEGASR
jgi:non-ribosomal peptide synthetase-like protein